LETVMVNLIFNSVHVSVKIFDSMLGLWNRICSGWECLEHYIIHYCSMFSVEFALYSL
jgi:hypothetical protein